MVTNAKIKGLAALVGIGNMVGDAELALVPTKCTPLYIDKRPQFQAVVHNSDGIRLASVPKRSKSTRNHSGEEHEERPELDMKRARYEIMKFGRSGLQGLEREKADEELAISLGAIPPKKECVNYKNLLQKKKEMKDIKEVQLHSVVKLKLNLKKGKEKKGKGKEKRKGRAKEKRKGESIIESYGKAKLRKGFKDNPKEKKRKENFNEKNRKKLYKI